MQYTKPMIDLIYAIRRLCPSDLKPAIKMANPEIFDELNHHYHGGANAVNKALIKELFLLAGKDWEAKLNEGTNTDRTHRVKVYRGQTILEERPKKADSSKSQKPKMMYRGHQIA